MIKISPDINDNEISKIVELVNNHNIQGIIVSNTTEVIEIIYLILKNMKREDYQDNHLKIFQQI